MGDVVCIRDFERKPSTYVPSNVVDLRDKVSARIYILPIARIDRIKKALSPVAQCAPRLQSAKLLPPIFRTFDDKKS